MSMWNPANYGGMQQQQPYSQQPSDYASPSDDYSNYSPSPAPSYSNYSPTDAYSNNYSPSYSNYAPSDAYSSNYSPSDYNSYSNYSPSSASNYSPTSYDSNSYAPTETYSPTSYSDYSPNYSPTSSYTYSPYNYSTSDYKGGTSIYSPHYNYNYTYPTTYQQVQTPAPCPPPQQCPAPQQDDDSTVLIQLIIQLLQQACSTEDSSPADNADCEPCDNNGSVDDIKGTDSAEGGCGDPHLVQMSPGSKSWYDFQGKRSGGTYNWYSNQDIQVNAKLIDCTLQNIGGDQQGVTAIGEVGIQLKDKTGDGVSKIDVKKDGTTTLTKSDGSTTNVADGTPVTVETSEGKTTITRTGQKVTVANNGNKFTFQGNGTNIDITDAQNLKKNIFSAGVLGGTDNGTGKAMGTWDANGDGKIDYNNGEGIVSGKNATDSEITGDDLWGTQTVTGDGSDVLFKSTVSATPDFNGDGKADAIFVKTANGKTALNAVRDGDKLVGVMKVGNKYFINDGVGKDKKTHLRQVTVGANNHITIGTDIKKDYLDFNRDLKGTVWGSEMAGVYAKANNITAGADANNNWIPDNIENDANFDTFANSKLNKNFAFDPWGLTGKATRKTAGRGATNS